MEGNNLTKDNIDYIEKIRNFQAMVDNYNEEIALNFLTKADWDETKATQLYLNDTRNDRGHNTMETPHYAEDLYPQNKQNRSYRRVSQTDDNEIRTSLVTERTRTEERAQEQPGIFQRFIVRPLSYLGSFFCSRRGDTTEDENHIFEGLPERVSNMNTFNTLIKTRLGLLVLYQLSDGEYFHKLVNDIKKEEYIMDVLKVNYVIFPVLIDSPEGARIISLISEQMLYPSVIVAYNKRQNNSFNRGCIIDRLEGHVSLDVFRDNLIRNVEIKENMNKSNSNLSATATLIQQQKEEIEQLEKMENEKKRREHDERIRIQKETEEKKKIEEEKEKMKLERKSLLVEEPADKDPQATHIIFRYPDGNRRAERRFYKSDKIQTLYHFVDSLGTDIFNESDSYDLIQPFPFTVYSNMEKTLMEEKLFPNAVLQIREL